MMNNRTKTLWLPALVSLTGSMVWMLILQRTFPQSQTLLNHAGLPLAYQLLWLAALPLCGGVGAYLSRRAGGERRACLAAGLFPVIAMTSLVGFLTVIGKFVYAKPQWLNFSIAALFGLILPGMALFLGAVPLAKAREYRSAS